MCYTAVNYADVLVMQSASFAQWNSLVLNMKGFIQTLTYTNFFILRMVLYDDMIFIEWIFKNGT